MNKKLQVFVSSTYTDLTDERETAVEAILDAGHIPAGMELFKAGKSQMKTIQKWIDESDVYMLILGGRYGSIEPDSGKSYTELEYEYALSKNMPVFAIVLEESFLYTKAASKGKDAIFEKDNIDKYNTFKNYVETKIVKFVANIDQIPGKIHSQLNDIINDSDYHLVGWVRSSISSSNSDENTTYRQLIENNKSLVKENKFLVKRNDSLDNEIRNLLNELPNKSAFLDDYSCQELIDLFKNTHVILTRSHSLLFRHFNVLEYFLKFRNEFRSSTGHKPISNECCIILKEFRLIKIKVTDENKNTYDYSNPIYIMSREGGIFDVFLTCEIKKRNK